MTGVRHCVIAAAVLSWVLLLPAAAQTTAPPPAQPSRPWLWLAGGGGFAMARAGCATCDTSGVFTNSRSLLIDAGVRVTPKVETGIELLWVTSRLIGEDPVRTTFILGVAQLRPMTNHGWFVRTGMGIAFAGNGLYSPLRPNLAPPYSTNALGITYGTGWMFRRERRWAFQVHALHHVAALGELTAVTGSTVKNVVGNYWTSGGALVFR